MQWGTNIQLCLIFQKSYEVTKRLFHTEGEGGGRRLVVGKKEVPTIANPMQILLHIFYMFQSQEFVSLRQIHREKTH